MASAVILAVMWEGAERSRVIAGLQNRGGEKERDEGLGGTERGHNGGLGLVLGLVSLTGFRTGFPHWI